MHVSLRVHGVGGRAHDVLDLRAAAALGVHHEAGKEKREHARHVIAARETAVVGADEANGRLRGAARGRAGAGVRAIVFFVNAGVKAVVVARRPGVLAPSLPSKSLSH